ncbi:hypothetical protein D3C71_1885410 [compost metagenome]
MNFLQLGLLQRQAFTLLLHVPEGIQRFHYRNLGKVIELRRGSRCPFQSAGIPRITADILRPVAEAPIEVVAEYGEAGCQYCAAQTRKQEQR